MITYRVGNELDVDAMIDVYRNSTLGARRPIEERERMAAMLQHANLVVTAWDGDQMVGVARALTDFVYVTYLADLVVRESHQRMGIGTGLMRKVREEAPRATLTLLAAPQAVEYYPRVGFTRHESSWLIRAEEELKD